MDGLNITHHDHGTRGEYRAHLEGHDETGLLTYVWRGDRLVADHTIVPPAIGGRGVAAELVLRLVGDAREKGWKIVPQCSYIDAMFRRHPDWADLRA